jgi:hypothetical protein
MKKAKSFFTLGILLCVSVGIQAQFDVKLHLTEGITDTVIKSAIERNTSLLLSEIGNAFAEGRTPDFEGIAISAEASKTILDIWNNTSVLNCTISELNRKCLKKYNGGYQVREIPVQLLAAAPDDQSQFIVINYTNEGVIDDIFVSKEECTLSTVLTEGAEVREVWRRQRIADFVEQFRTAYNTKDLDFLNMMFSDKALIITGKVVKVLPNPEQKIQVPAERIEYTVQTKKQYLDKLAYLFYINKYINIQFSEFEVQQHTSNHDLYGVIVKQVWNSQYYKDAGYVFLMIDFKNESKPIIHIRTWQPEKYNGQQLSKNEIFSVTSFDITHE